MTDPLQPRRDLPEWPTWVLPDWAADHITYTSTRLQVPTDLVGQLLMGAISAVSMGHARVHADGGWVEPVNVYLWCAMPSGAGKSPAAKAVIGPVEDWEQERVDMLAHEHQLAKTLYRRAQKNLRAVEDNPGATESEIRAAIEELAGLKAPEQFRLIVDDATPERLTQLLGRHSGQLAVISTEGNLLDRVAGGQNVDPTVFLKAWSGDTIIRDRVGGADGPEEVRILDPLLTVALTLQPSMIQRYQLENSNMLRDRGFFARFMPSIPEYELGNRTYESDPVFDADCKAIAAVYGEKIQHLAGLLAGAFRIELTLAGPAQEAFSKFYADTEAEIGAGGRLEVLGEAISKIRSTVLRSAGLLHLAHGHQGNVIGGDIMDGAIALGHYWIDHMLELERTALVDVSEEATLLALAREIIAWAVNRRTRHKGNGFTPGEVVNTFRKREAHTYDTQVEDYAEALELLVENDLLTLLEGEMADLGTRRKTVRFALTTAGINSTGRPVRMVPEEEPGKHAGKRAGEPARYGALSAESGSKRAGLTRRPLDIYFSTSSPTHVGTQGPEPSDGETGAFGPARLPEVIDPDLADFLRDFEL